MRFNLRNSASFLCVSFLSCVAFAQEAAYTDLYYNADYNTGGWASDRYMQNPSLWNVGSPDGPIFGGEVNSETNNLFLVSSDPITGSFQTFFGYNSNIWNVHNITVDFLMGQNYSILGIVPNQKLHVGGNLDISIKSYANWWMPNNNIALTGENSGIVVDGDLNFVNATTKADVEANGRGQNGLIFSIEAHNMPMSTSFEVKGNLTFKSADTYSYQSDYIQFANSVTSLKVGGYVDMTETRAGTFAWDLCKTSQDSFFPI